MIYDTRTLESIRPPSNDERMAAWAYKYLSGGYHRNPPCNDDETRVIDSAVGVLK